MSSTETKLLVANWKSQLQLLQIQEWLKTFSLQEKRTNREYVLCPPQPFLGYVGTQNVFSASPETFTLGAQNLSVFEAGAYTGESSASAAHSLGAQFAILGHSERRKYFRETSQEVAQKAELALSWEITPIICVDQDQFEDQVHALNKKTRDLSIFAYEPIHAISSFGGQEDPLETTLQAIAKLRELVGDDAEVLYGGSVDKENSLTYLSQESISGALVGKSSLDPVLFAQL